MRHKQTLKIANNEKEVTIQQKLQQKNKKVEKIMDDKI